MHDSKFDCDMRDVTFQHAGLGHSENQGPTTSVDLQNQRYYQTLSLALQCVDMRTYMRSCMHLIPKILLNCSWNFFRFHTNATQITYSHKRHWADVQSGRQTMQMHRSDDASIRERCLRWRYINKHWWRIPWQSHKWAPGIMLDPVKTSPLRLDLKRFERITTATHVREEAQDVQLLWHRH